MFYFYNLIINHPPIQRVLTIISVKLNSFKDIDIFEVRDYNT